MKKTIVLLLLALPFLNSARNNVSIGEIDSLILRYIGKKVDKEDFLNSLIKIGVGEENYEEYLKKLEAEEHSKFYRTLASIDYLVPKTYKKSEEEFLTMAFDNAISIKDSAACYVGFIYLYLVRIGKEYNEENQNKYKFKFDSIASEINSLTCTDSITLELKHTTKHNSGIVERYMFNFDDSEKLFKEIDAIEKLEFGTCEQKVDEVSNSINDLSFGSKLRRQFLNVLKK